MAQLAGTEDERWGTDSADLVDEPQGELPGQRADRAFRFLNRLKDERVHDVAYVTRETAIADLFDYIEVFCNRAAETYPQISPKYYFFQSVPVAVARYTGADAGTGRLLIFLMPSGFSVATLKDIDLWTNTF